jgi:hypothetical protein
MLPAAVSRCRKIKYREQNHQPSVREIISLDVDVRWWLNTLFLLQVQLNEFSTDITKLLQTRSWKCVLSKQEYHLPCQFLAGGTIRQVTCKVGELINRGCNSMLQWWTTEKHKKNLRASSNRGLRQCGLQICNWEEAGLGRTRTSGSELGEEVVVVLEQTVSVFQSRPMNVSAASELRPPPSSTTAGYKARRGLLRPPPRRPPKPRRLEVPRRPCPGVE